MRRQAPSLRRLGRNGTEGNAMTAPKKPQANPLSDQHVELFDLFVQKWAPILNLSDWRIVRDKRRRSKYMAEMHTVEVQHKLAKYRVGEAFGDNHAVTPETLEATAVHELLHLRLWELLEYVELHGQDEI